MINREVKSKNDVEFLRLLSKTLNHKVRLLFNPNPSRMRPDVEPKEVTFMTDELCFAEYMAWEYDRYNHGEPAHELLAHAPAAAAAV